MDREWREDVRLLLYTSFVPGREKPQKKNKKTRQSESVDEGLIVVVVVVVVFCILPPLCLSRKVLYPPRIHSDRLRSQLCSWFSSLLLLLLFFFILLRFLLNDFLPSSFYCRWGLTLLAFLPTASYAIQLRSRLFHKKKTSCALYWNAYTSFSHCLHCSSLLLFPFCSIFTDRTYEDKILLF